jgi:hypothetical protein
MGLDSIIQQNDGRFPQCIVLLAPFDVLLRYEHRVADSPDTSPDHERNLGTRYVSRMTYDRSVIEFCDREFEDGLLSWPERR